LKISRKIWTAWGIGRQEMR